MTKILNIGKFAIKNAFRKKTIAALAITGIAIGLTMQIVINSFNAGLSEHFDELFSELVGTFELQEKDQPSTFMSQLPADVIETILQSNYSEDIIGISGEQQLPTSVGELYSDVLGTNILGRPMSMNVRGVNLTNFLEVSSDLDELTSNSRYFSAGADECIIPYDMWANNTELFDIGKILSLKINDTYYYNLTIVGVTERSTGGLRQSFMRMGYDIYTSIEVSTKVLTELLRPENHVTHYEARGYTSSRISPENYNVITVKTSLTDADAIEDFMKKVIDMLEQNYPSIQFSSYSTAQALSEMGDFSNTMNTVMMIISIVTVAAGGMGIIIAQLVGVDSRMKEFAILKATGWKEKHIMLSVLIESITLGILGALTASALSGIVILLFSNMPGPAPTPVLTPSLLIVAFGISLLLGLIGGIYPGFRASTVNPIDILRGG
ncbi:MAG: ABC transporter permease [Candidatus Heimdallarchaeaceae archaeon]